MVSSALEASVPRLEVGDLGDQNVHVLQRLGKNGGLVFLLRQKCKDQIEEMCIRWLIKGGVELT
jgi:hypothetical protein